MNFVLRLHRPFLKKWEWYVSRNASLQESILKSLELLQESPMHPGLRSHKARDKDNRIVFSSRVTGDLRMIWDYSAGAIRVIDVLDLGGHSGRRKVYQ